MQGKALRVLLISLAVGSWLPSAALAAHPCDPYRTDQKQHAKCLQDLQRQQEQQQQAQQQAAQRAQQQQQSQADQINRQGAEQTRQLQAQFDRDARARQEREQQLAAQIAIENQLRQAEAARNLAAQNAESARRQAENQRAYEENTRRLAEQERQSRDALAAQDRVNAARAEAANRRAAEETARRQAEADRQAAAQRAEQERQNEARIAEMNRKAQEETARRNAEAERQAKVRQEQEKQDALRIADANRKAQEDTARRQAETDRQAAAQKVEQDRQNSLRLAETNRKNQEDTSRLNAEYQKQANEKEAANQQAATNVAAENLRQQQNTSRLQAESEKQSASQRAELDKQVKASQELGRQQAATMAAQNQRGFDESAKHQAVVRQESVARLTEQGRQESARIADVNRKAVEETAHQNAEYQRQAKETEVKNQALGAATAAENTRRQQEVARNLASQSTGATVVGARSSTPVVQAQTAQLPSSVIGARSAPVIAQSATAVPAAVGARSNTATVQTASPPIPSFATPAPIQSNSPLGPALPQAVATATPVVGARAGATAGNAALAGTATTSHVNPSSPALHPRKMPVTTPAEADAIRFANQPLYRQIAEVAPAVEKDIARGLKDQTIQSAQGAVAFAKETKEVGKYVAQHPAETTKDVGASFANAASHPLQTVSTAASATVGALYHGAVDPVKSLSSAVVSGDGYSAGKALPGAVLSTATVIDGAAALREIGARTAIVRPSVSSIVEKPIPGVQVISSDVTNGTTENIRNAKLAGKIHPVTGVPFNSKGYPDFSSFAKAEVNIKSTGTRRGDAAAANKAAGLENTSEGYTWHHHEDGSLMQLVPRDIHSKTGHTGGYSIGPK